MFFNKCNDDVLLVNYNDLNIAQQVDNKKGQSLTTIKYVMMVMMTLKKVALRNNKCLLIIIENNKDKDNCKIFQSVVQFADRVILNGVVIKDRWPQKK